MTCREQLEASLRQHRIPFGTHALGPVEAALPVAEHETIPSQLMVDVALAVADGEPLMLVLPASRRPDLARIATLLKRREVRLATKDERASIAPDCDGDAIPPFGELYGLRVYLDQAIEGHRIMFFRVGNHQGVYSVALADFKRLVGPTVMNLTRMRMSDLMSDSS
jgi:Ala-tRNA(Pro) deacylase